MRKIDLCLRHFRVIFISISLIFTSCELPTPCKDKETIRASLSGGWNIRGLGRLTSCRNNDYNTESFLLNTQNLRVHVDEDGSISSTTWPGSCSERPWGTTAEVPRPCRVCQRLFGFHTYPEPQMNFRNPP